METLVEIIKTIIWPTTVLISVLALRKGIIELIPNLKKLKYKDLELEFETEAIKILAIIERDVPKIEPPEEKPPEEYIVSEPPPMFSRRKLSPLSFILSEWDTIEKAIFSLSERHNIDTDNLKSIRSTTTKLREVGVIDDTIECALLELSAYRNKVTHTPTEIISENMSNIYHKSAKIVITYLNSL